MRDHAHIAFEASEGKVEQIFEDSHGLCHGIYSRFLRMIA